MSSIAMKMIMPSSNPVRLRSGGVSRSSIFLIVRMGGLPHKEEVGLLLDVTINIDIFHFCWGQCLLKTHIDCIAIGFKQCMSFGFLEVAFDHFLAHLLNRDFWGPAQFGFGF